MESEAKVRTLDHDSPYASVVKTNKSLTLNQSAATILAY